MRERITLVARHSALHLLIIYEVRMTQHIKRDKLLRVLELWSTLSATNKDMLFSFIMPSSLDPLAIVAFLYDEQKPKTVHLIFNRLKHGLKIHICWRLQFRRSTSLFVGDRACVTDISEPRKQYSTSGTVSRKSEQLTSSVINTNSKENNKQTCVVHNIAIGKSHGAELADSSKIRLKISVKRFIRNIWWI
ncbi:hypothetical protein GQR58_022912 [Nymphon striatum]|nr:hypothetical protein GQR58_022912 [Nymphon striatum]